MLPLVLTQFILPILLQAVLLVAAYGAFPERYTWGPGLMGESRFDRETRIFWRRVMYVAFAIPLLLSVWDRSWLLDEDLVNLWRFLRENLAW